MYLTHNIGNASAFPIIWPVRRSPTELRVQPTPDVDGSDSIANSVDFDTTVFFFFLLISEKATRAGDAKQRK